MKGTLHKTETGWVVRWPKEDPRDPEAALPLHPEYEKYYFLDEDAEGGEVEFDWCVIVDHDSGKGTQYAKLERQKEQTNGERFEEFMKIVESYPELEGTNALCDDIIKKRTGKMTEEEWQAAERAQTSKRTNMTAVELLKQDIDLEIKSGTKMVVNWDMYLEMEKQQIIDAAERWKGTDFAEQYYNETYGSKGSEHHIVDTNEMVSSQTSEQIAIDFAEWLLDYNPTMLYQKTKKELFKEWNECSTSSQTERIYSEEEVLEIVSNCDGSISQAKKWFEQFKKK